MKPLIYNLRSRLFKCAVGNVSRKLGERMALLMGPVLSFRGCDDNQWNVTALVVSKDDPGTLSAGGQSFTAETLWKHRLGTAYRYTLAFAMKDKPATASYTVDKQKYEIAIPAIDQAPTMAYASCNGFSSSKLIKSVEKPNSLWSTMAQKHGLSLARGEKDDDLRQGDANARLNAGGAIGSSN